MVGYPTAVQNAASMDRKKVALSRLTLLVIDLQAFTGDASALSFEVLNSEQ
jgi:hypothetical protein